MNRFQVHVAVEDLGGATRFHSILFGAEPAVVKDEYAKWMLGDPKVNVAKSTRGGAAGVDHLGIQVESGDALGELSGRIEAAGADRLDENVSDSMLPRSWRQPEWARSGSRR